jgi:hypothetical protein
MHGKITQRVPEGTEGAIVRTNKLGVTVHEVRYDYVGGLLLDIGTTSHKDYGEQWQFTLQDGAEIYCLQLSENSKELTSLLMALPSCNVKKLIAIHPYSFMDADGKKHQGVTLKQEGKKVEWFFTRENPNGLPELKVTTTADGKETFDGSEQLQFLRRYVDQHISPQLPGMLLQSPDNVGEEANPSDLPF